MFRRSQRNVKAELEAPMNETGGQVEGCCFGAQERDGS